MSNYHKHITRNDIRAYGDTVYYCVSFDADYIMRYCRNAIDLGYNAGYYGHNWRAYRVFTGKCDSCIILTGYRNFIGKPIYDEQTLRQIIDR